MKKIVSLLLILTLAIGIFAGCKGEDTTTSPEPSKETSLQDSSTEETEEPIDTEETSGEIDTSEEVALSWLLRIPEQNDQQLVQEEVDRIVKEEINATLHMDFIEAAAYPEKVKLKFASGENFDLLWLNSGTYSTYVTQKALMAMDPYIDTYSPGLKEIIPAEFWPATEINGETYAITNYQICARQFTLLPREDLVEKYSIDTSTITSLETFEPFMKAVKEGEEDGMVIYNGGLNPTALDTLIYLGFEVIGDTRSPGAIRYNGDATEVVNQFDTPEVRELFSLARNWYEEGYLDPDLVLGQNAEELSKNGKVASLFATYKPGLEAETKARYGFEPSVIPFGEPYVATSNIQGTMTGLSFTSENPERAMMLLNLVNTNPELYNTIVYGLEDKHYMKTSEDSIELIEDSGYHTNVPWMIGNTMNAYRLPGTSDTIAQETDDLNRKSATSPILGFYFDPETVKTEIASCNTILDNYLESLAYGTYDNVEETIDQMNQELMDSGMQTILDEKQAQLDAWFAEN